MLKFTQVWLLMGLLQFPNITISSDITLLNDSNLIKTLGCWKDSIPRAIRSHEDLCLYGVPTNRCYGVPYCKCFDEHYKRRSDAITKCFKIALISRHTVFAIQDGGQCFTSKTANETYNMYGPSSDCLDDGKGGPMANSVYQINENRCYMCLINRFFTLKPK